jgi:cytochrome P450
MTTVDTAAIDLVGQSAVTDPHGTFAGLRQRAPVHWLSRHNAWLLLDYELVKRAIQDDAFSTDTITPLYSKLTLMSGTGSSWLKSFSAAG